MFFIFIMLLFFIRRILMKNKTLLFLFIILFLNNLLYASTEKSINSIKLKLTQKEKVWIKNHPVIKIGNMNSFPPYGFIEDKIHKGLNIEYIEDLSKLTGINIKFVTVKSIDDLKRKFQKKEIDTFAGFSSYLNDIPSIILTKSFLTSFDSIITRKDSSFLANYKHLFGKKVAVIQGYHYENIIKKFYPEINLVLVKDTLEGLNKVDQYEVDAFLSNNDVSLYLLNKYNFDNLRLGVPVNFPNIEIGEQLNFAIRDDWQELKSILEKSIKIYSNKRLINLERKWLDPTKNLTSTSIKFTKEEKDWIQSNIVKVGGQMDWIPFDFVNNFGQYKGIVKDLLDLVSKKSGLKFEYNIGKTWHELVESFKAGEIDIMPAMYMNEERLQYASFTRPYMKIRNYVFMKTNKPNITSIDEIKNKRIVYVDGYNSLDKILLKYPNIKLLKVNTIQEAVDAVVLEKADFYIEDYPIVMFYLSSHMQKGIKPVLAVPHDQKNVHIAINKNKKMLIQIFHKIESNFTYSEVNKVLTKWLYNNENSEDIIFTKKELEWLDKNKSLTYSATDWKPLTILEKGKMIGITAEYLDIVQKYTGINFVFKPSKYWNQVLQKFDNEEIDFIPGIGEAKEMYPSGLMSESYVKYPMVIITKDEIPYVKSLNDLKNKTFSVPINYTSHKYLKATYSNVKIIETNTIQEALLNVSNGLADAYIGHLIPSLYYLKETGRNNLQISGNAKFKFKHHFLISEKHPEFVSIVNKIMEKITKKEKDNIYNKWIKIEIKSSFDYSILWNIGIVLLLIFLIIIYYNGKVRLQRKFFKTLIDSQEQMVVTTDGHKLFNVNKTFLDFFDVANEKVFESRIAQCISDTFDEYSPKEYLQKQINGYNWIDYILNNPHKVYKVRILKNNNFRIFSVTASLLPGKRKLMSAVFTDITEMETAKNNIENIISSILLPVVIISKEEQKILYLNTHAEKIFKASLKNLIGKNIDDILSFEGGTSAIDDILEHHGFIQNFETIISLKVDNTNFNALLSISKIKYLGNESLMGTFADITKMKEMENEIRLNHKNTQDSIQYASLIQETFIPENKLFTDYFSEHFTIWEPKDIVGGDIYLFDGLRNENECLIMIIDCTGHGVAGAFVTMLVKAIERQIILSMKYEIEKKVNPSEILTTFNQNMKNLLKQNSKDSISNAGFDGAVIYYNKKDSIIKFAGAESSLFYIKNDSLTRIKGDRHSIGYKTSDSNYQFKNHTINIEKGMQFYITTDGYMDQNGGEKGFCFGRNRFTALIEKNHTKSFEEQKSILLESLTDYQGQWDRNDDITVLGFKI